MSRMRADVLVVEQGLAPTRSKAQALILAGAVVTDNGECVAKPGALLQPSVDLRLRGQLQRFVSRGGNKLDAALEHFQIDVTNHICLDIGASTGGFTDCLLQRGAARVYALDVGYGQMAWSIRQDPRVVVIERTNIRHAEPAVVPEACSRVVIDVSFISLKLVLPHALRFAAPAADFICLVKPQFEVGRSDIGKGGIVTDPAARRAALDDLRQTIGQLGLTEVGFIDSPIQGAKGNHEFLLVGRRG